MNTDLNSNFYFILHDSFCSFFFSFSIDILRIILWGIEKEMFSIFLSWWKFIEIYLRENSKFRELRTGLFHRLVGFFNRLESCHQDYDMSVIRCKYFCLWFRNDLELHFLSIPSLIRYRFRNKKWRLLNFYMTGFLNVQEWIVFMILHRKYL